MARKTSRRQSPLFVKKDLNAWSFAIFLTLALVLLVAVVGIVNGLSLDIRSRAGLACPNPLAAFNGKLPPTEQCNGEWKLANDARGCQTFFCTPILPKEVTN
jgi:hypothetical protein